jgi:PAS domain S-box-containing protein
VGAHAACLGPVGLAQGPTGPPAVRCTSDAPKLVLRYFPTVGHESIRHSHVQEAVGAGEIHRVGWYRFHFAGQRWEWSPEVERIHGYEPGTARPTTSLVLSHKHPDDRPHVEAVLEEVLTTQRPFSTRHRIVNVHGETREVVVIGEQLRNGNGEVVGSQGFYIDATPSLQTRQSMISHAVAEIREHRAVIEQAKGILMFVYRVDAESAFEMLRWRSQQTNVKLRDLAACLVADVKGLPYGGSEPVRAFDRLLLTAHERIRASDNR